MKSVYDITPAKIKIEGKSWQDDLLQQLAAREILIFHKCADYWRPLLERGRRLERYFMGDIFTPAQRAMYKHNEQIPIESPIMKAPIRALVGQALKSRKSGQVVTESRSANEAGDNQKEIETLNIVMKDIEVKSGEEYQIKEAMMSAFVSCYWNVLLFDKVKPSRNSNGARYKMAHLPWNSCIFGPLTARQTDGSDIKEIFFFDYRSIADLIDNYPDMEKQITDHFLAKDNVDDKLLSSIAQWEGTTTADERDTMYNVLSAAENARHDSQGLAQVVMHIYPVKQKQEVWINIFDDTGEDFEIRPPDWDDERWNLWVSQNSQKYAGPYEREVVTLWMTVFTTSGLVLANQAHWFQENGMLPCSFWLGAMSANKPTGPMVDMNDEVLANCVAEIEYLDDLRKGSGRTLFVKEGAIKNVENLAEEVNRALGALIVSKDFDKPLSEAFTEIVRKPNDNWKTYAEQRKSSMAENTRINETMLGATAPRQSAIAKEAEISQALTVNATYIDNLNRSWDYHQNLKLKLIPYLYDTWEVIEVRDDKTGENMMVEVNAPQEYDMEGNVTSVVNDLTAHRYRFKINPVDDSPTAKVRNIEDALTIINGAAGPLLQADPSGQMFATFLMSLDNPFLAETGSKLLQTSQASSQAASQKEDQKASLDQLVKVAKARADLLRAQKHGNMTTWNAEGMEDYPGLKQLWLQLQDLYEQGAERDFQEVQQITAPQQAQLPAPEAQPPMAETGAM